MLPAAIHAQAVGSRENPVPMGTSVVISDDNWEKGNNWEVTVLDAFPNATEEMVYGKDPTSRFKLDPGSAYFVAKIRAKYIGPKSDYFDSDVLKIVGSASIAYRPINQVQAIGTIPNQIPGQEVFTGGVITGIVVWMIPPEHADHLVMYDSSLDFDERTYMALFQR
jgi:hypothetical protein